MGNRLRFLLNRISERLWVKPLAMCVLSIAAAFVAKAVDDTGLGRIVPEISTESIETLLKTISASMLVIATFSVASMVAAYASASSTATPRSFALVVSDDASQNALSTFIGAFIFSIVALIALKNGYYGKAGHFALFLLTLLVFATVILTFVRWVDRIARLGRLGTTIDVVEKSTAEALQRRRCDPHMGGVAAGPHRNGSLPVHGRSIGYVQRLDTDALQSQAEAAKLRVTVAALPGTFVTPERVLARVTADAGSLARFDPDAIAQAFTIGSDRKFDDDPRFGLIVLSEIASRALSPAVNDPGTAIDILGRFVRLFALWVEPLTEREMRAPRCDRVEVPALSLPDLFDDAFTAIARDGAGTVEVAGRLQKALASLAGIGHPALREAALRHSLLALSRSERAMELPEDLEVVRKRAGATRKTTS